MIIKHFCNTTFQGEYSFDSIFKDKGTISYGSLFSIKGTQYRVTNILIRNKSEIVIESLKTVLELHELK